MTLNNHSDQNSPAEVAALLDEYIEMLHIKSPHIHALRDNYRHKAGIV